MRISRPRGARIAPIALAVEPRFKASVLYLGGLMSAPRRPEVDEVNFLPRVKIPALMLSGKYDDVFPLEAMAAPYFRGLGTPAEHKRHLVYPTQHFLQRDEQITATLNWLDRYLGPGAEVAGALLDFRSLERLLKNTLVVSHRPVVFFSTAERRATQGGSSWCWAARSACA